MPEVAPALDNGSGRRAQAEQRHASAELDCVVPRSPARAHAEGDEAQKIALASFARMHAKFEAL